MIHYNSPEHQKERANVVPLSMEEITELIKYLNIYENYTPKAFQERMQRLIYDWENLTHMRETAPVWISVSDSLPEPDTAVLIYANTGIQTCYFDSTGDFYSGSAILTEFITHWQPLPQTPTK